MNLNQLYETQRSGALNIKYDENNMSIGYIADTSITKEQAEKMCRSLGWTEIALHPFKLIEKTNKVVRTLNNNIDIPFRYANVTFRNIQSVEYGKTFDIIILDFTYKGTYTIVYNQPHAGAKCLLYGPGSSAPIGKYKTVKRSCEEINKRLLR